MLPRFLAFWVLLPMALLAMAAEPGRTYTISITPQLPAEKIHAAWTPLLAALSRETGDRFELVIPQTIPDNEALVLAGKPDFAFLNPYLMVMARRSQRYIPLVRGNKEPLRGLLAVRKDSPIRTVADLQGATIAFPSPNAFGASLYLRSLLAQQKVKFTPTYVDSHSNVYRHVLIGEAAAGGGINFTFERQPKEVRDELRVIFTTPPAPPLPLAAHPRVSPEVRERVTRVLLALSADPALAPVIEACELGPPTVRADYDKDYRALETLGLDRFVVEGAR